MTSRRPPNIVVVGGPNGAGKSTTGPRLLRDLLRIQEFVNADAIAQGLSAFEPGSVAFQAGRIMLGRVRDLARRRADFAFETTLAARSFAPWLVRMRRRGYRVHVLFLWLGSRKLALERVAARVRAGGHAVAVETVRRRYGAGVRNLFSLYLPVADSWQIYDNSDIAGPRLVAAREKRRRVRIMDRATWRAMEKAAGDEKFQP